MRNFSFQTLLWTTINAKPFGVVDLFVELTFTMSISKLPEYYSLFCHK